MQKEKIKICSIGNLGGYTTKVANACIKIVKM